MKNYLNLLTNIINEGVDRKGRNATTRALFSRTLRFEMSDGFPAVTTKRLAFYPMVAELICFLNGVTDNNVFRQLGCNIWTNNANASYWKAKAKFDGDLGRIYGAQWLNWPIFEHQEAHNLGDSWEENKFVRRSLNQISELIERLKINPYDRRHVVTAWNPGELDQMALPPCHMFFQCFVANGKLSLDMTQRSCDMFLGVPFNIASYALLLHLLARFSGLTPGELVISLKDAHIYHDHFDAVDEQLSREPYCLPELFIDQSIQSLDDLTIDKVGNPENIKKLFGLVGYKHHPAISAKMVV